MSKNNGNGSDQLELFELPHPKCTLVKEHEKKIKAAEENLEAIVINTHKSAKKLDVLLDNVADGFRQTAVRLDQLENVILQVIKLVQQYNNK